MSDSDLARAARELLVALDKNARETGRACPGCGVPIDDTHRTTCPVRALRGLVDGQPTTCTECGTDPKVCAHLVAGKGMAGCCGACGTGSTHDGMAVGPQATPDEWEVFTAGDGERAIRLKQTTLDQVPTLAERIASKRTEIDSLGIVLDTEYHTLEDVFADHRQWAYELWGKHNDPSGTYDKAMEEFGEFTDEPSIAEAVDVILVLVLWADRAGHTPAQLTEALASKVAINRERTWDKQLSHHIEEAPVVATGKDPA